MKDNLSKMDLSRYLHVVLHIGGHDVDANISKTAFQESYKALVEFLVKKAARFLFPVFYLGEALI